MVPYFTVILVNMAPSSFFHRMPLGYGPCPGPRQTADGSSIAGWDQVRSNTSTILFRCLKKQLQDLLPSECFEIIPDDGLDELAYASLSFTRLENLPWLAGRGYNHCGLYIHNVICRGKVEQCVGKYLSVLFENLADPIISGREELGYAKLFAALEERSEPTSWTGTLSWEGSEFGKMRLDELSEKPPSIRSLLWELRPQNLLHYKYIPRTGSPGKADVEYPVISPVLEDPASNVVQMRFISKATFQLEALGVQELPTLHHILKKLTSLQICEVVGGLRLVTEGASDLKNQRAILV